MRAKVLKVKLSECREFQDTGADLGRWVNRNGETIRRNDLLHIEETHSNKHNFFWWLQGQTSAFIHSQNLINMLILIISFCIFPSAPRGARLRTEFQDFGGGIIIFVPDVDMIQYTYFYGIDCHSLFTAPFHHVRSMQSILKSFHYGNIFFEKLDTCCSCGGGGKVKDLKIIQLWGRGLTTS